jgi:hypothetical protein
VAFFFTYKTVTEMWPFLHIGGNSSKLLHLINRMNQQTNIHSINLFLALPSPAAESGLSWLNSTALPLPGTTIRQSVLQKFDE